MNQLLIVTVLATALAAQTAAADVKGPITFGSSGPVITYVVLGDSTAAGIGGSYDLGIAISTAKELGHRHVVTMTNFGVSGARMSDVRKLQLPLAEPLRPDIVLLSASGNDVTHLTSVRSMRADLRAIVQALTAANPDVQIVITGSPAMGTAPRIPRLLRGIAACRSKQVNRMFHAEEAASDHLVFARIADRTGPIMGSDPSLFASDRFHPNDRGYATWIPILNEALAIATRREDSPQRR